MADAQTSAPRLSHPVPSWLKKWADDTDDFLESQRVIGGIGVEITDADGGGKIISLGGDAVTLAAGYMAIAGDVQKVQLYLVAIPPAP